jgi:hypothetical protein
MTIISREKMLLKLRLAAFFGLRKILRPEDQHFSIRDVPLCFSHIMLSENTAAEELHSLETLILMRRLMVKKLPVEHPGACPFIFVFMHGTGSDAAIILLPMLFFSSYRLQGPSQVMSFSCLQNIS